MYYLMKSVHLKNCLLFLFLIACLVACKENLFEVNDTGDIEIESAEDWYNNQLNFVNTARTSDTVNTSKTSLRPNWSKYKKRKFNDREDILIVETDGYALGNSDLDFQRVFIFKSEDGKVLDGRIVEIIGKKEYIEKNHDRIPELYRSEHIPGFDGVIFGYDINYQYLDGYNYRNGKRSDEVTYVQWRSPGQVSDPSKSRVTSTLRVQEEIECWDVFWDTYTYGCACWNSQFLYSYCTIINSDGTISVPPGGIGGGGGGGITPPTAPSSPSMYVNSAQLTTPCLINVWNLIRDANFNNKVQNILFKFNESKSLQFTLKEHYTVGSRKPATTTVAASGLVTVSLNRWTLRNASKEAIVQTFFHEVLHVYLNGKDQSSDHQKMAQDYVPIIADAIESWYPNINQFDNPGDPSSPTYKEPARVNSAQALAWTGLQLNGAAEAWNALPIATRTQYTYLMNRYFNIDGDNTKPFGTPCP